MKPEFHLSLGVHSLRESIDFYTQVLLATVQHRDPSGYVNLNLHGSQITLKQNSTVKPGLPDFHFGVNLDLDEFDRLASHVLASGYPGIIARPTTVDAGTPLERRKMYLRCPTGYLVELKGYSASS